jgi:hypothetical protein
MSVPKWQHIGAKMTLRISHTCIALYFRQKKLSFSVLKAFSAMHHIWDALQGMKNAGIHPGPSAIAQKDVFS